MGKLILLVPLLALGCATAPKNEASAPPPSERIPNQAVGGFEQESGDVLQQSSSSTPMFAAFPVAVPKSAIAAKVDWTQKQSQGAKTYKTALEAALERFQKSGAGLAAGRFIVTTIGCGTECQLVGFVHAQTGVPSLPGLNSSAGVSYEPGSRLFILNPPEAIAASYPRGAPPYVKTEHYIISDSGEALRFFPERMATP